LLTKFITGQMETHVESLLLENEEVNVERLNTLVKKKYLTTFDIAPIDHIRELVKTNKKVRNAVLGIQQGKNNQLSDEIKKKLYLYGIINSSFDEDIFIKNPIIKSSLSSEWIKSIDKQTQDDFSYGLDKIDQLEYSEAITILSEFISNSSPSKPQLEVCNYYIGFAYYSLKDLENALLYFSKEYTLDPYHRNSKSFLGICKFGIGKKEEGIEILEELIREKSNDFAYMNATLNLARFTVADDRNKALNLYEKLYDSTYENSDDTKEEELDRLRTLAHYFKSEIYIEENSKTKALKSLKKALKYANFSDAVHLKFLIYAFLGKKNEKIKDEILDAIVEQKLKFDKGYSYPISFSEQNLYAYLDLYFDSENQSNFESLLDYSFTSLFNKKVDKYQIVYSLSTISSKSANILKYILANKDEVAETILLQVYKSLSFITSNKNATFFTYFNKYKDLFVRLDSIDSNDVHSFAFAIKKYYDTYEIQKGIELCRLIENRITNLEDEELKFESLIIYYWYSNLYYLLDDKTNSVRYADVTIKLIKESKKERTSLIDEKGLKSMVEEMYKIKFSVTVGAPISKVMSNLQKKYRPNDKMKVRYINGEIVEGKYKKLKADIKAGKCKILTN